jgi:putative lipoprotein
MVSSLRAILLSALTSSACAEELPDRPAVGDTRILSEESTTYFFVCEEKTTYTIRASATEAWVFRPQGSLRLPAVPSQIGTRYADAAFELRIEGERAWLDPHGGGMQSCRNDRRRAIWEKAKLDGADFRAVGNEPGWNLEIQLQTRIVLVADYGASRVELPLPQPTVDQDARITRWDAGELVLEVIGRPCTDTMSGERFESEVTVIWRGQILRGCGRALH